MNKKNIALSFAAALLSATSLCAAGGTNAVSGNAPEAYEISQTKKSQLKYARELLEHGMYAEARKIFSEYPADPVAGGYALMCDVKMKSNGYETKLAKYISMFPYSGLVPQLRYEYALNLFDEADYKAASAEFASVNLSGLYRNQLAAYTFKKAYSDFEIGQEEAALQGFMKVSGMKKNDYQAPAAYSIAYIWYGREKFSEAITWFEKSEKDPRFADVSSYYIMECRFMNKDYRYVTDNAAKMYASVPEERRPHLARIISESYLVQGDAESAKKYYDRTDVVAGKTRKDYFYAGSLLYALEDFKGAVDNYSLMTDRTDSLGQIANYQMGYSYIRTKNKVAAMQAFKDASAGSYDKAIQEDAYFNYAKLAFDLNNDPSVFDS